MDAIDRAIDGAASAPLTADQRRRLAIAGRTAWMVAMQSGQAPETFDAWRRRHTLIAVERAGIRACTQEDYAPLAAHFARVLGEAEASLGNPARARRSMRLADRMSQRAACAPRRVAAAKLESELHAAADCIERPRAYVASIARARFRTAALEDLTERQIWMLVYDLRRNASRRRTKAKGGRR
jgi:hypothetical protein